MSEPASRTGWTPVAFGDVVRLSRERCNAPEQDGFERYVGLEHLEPGDLRIRDWGRAADGTTFTSVFRSGQVLFGKRRAYQRKVAVADFDGVCSGDIYVFEPKDEHLLPDLLPFICQTDGFLEHAVGTSAGSLSPRTHWKSLEKYEFALPPLAEQRRIADALWALEQLRRRLSAVRDHETELWISLFRAIAGIETVRDEDAASRGELRTTRNGWELCPVAAVCTRERQGVQVGPFGGSVSTRHFAAQGVPVLKINNITEYGTLDLATLVYLNQKQAASLSGRYSVRVGDLVTAAQATIGRTAVVDDRIDGAIISQHIIRISPNQETCLSAWLHSCFCSPLVLRQLRSVIQGGTRAGLNTDDVASIIVPVPPIDDQKRFVEQLEAAQGLRRACASRWTAIDGVRQSVMSAMRGGGV